MPEPRAAVVMDYQNVHLTGHERFAATRHLPKHECLVDPLLFAQQLLYMRNSRQHPGRAHAILRCVDVYSGEPSSTHDPKGYARNHAQRAHWERDKRVTVTYRPLKYRYDYDAEGRRVCDAFGVPIPNGSPREKGVDVLCALAMVRHALRDDVDLVILASLDSDLVPAVDELLRLGTAKVETFCWSSGNGGYHVLRPSEKANRIWFTPLTEHSFLSCIDRTDYS